MKTHLKVFVLACLIISSSFCLACGGCGGCGGSSGNCEVYAEDNCMNTCCPYDTPCQCTDPGANWNDCMNRCEYCEAFGNVGAR